MNRKINNNKLIIVGGTIAAGKSTLVEQLAKKLNWNFISELREKDKLQDIILKKLYEGNRLHLATVQYYFLANRYKQYKEANEMKKNVILDRSIWEDWIFAKLLMKDEKQSYKHYKHLWHSTVKKILTQFGAPLIYIYLEIDWKTFEKRIFERNRETEIKNFEKNKKYFKKLLKEYVHNFEKILKKSNIKVYKINSINLSKQKVLSQVLKKINNLIL